MGPRARGCGEQSVVCVVRQHPRKSRAMEIQCCLYSAPSTEPSAGGGVCLISAASHLSRVSHKALEGSPANIRELLTFLMHTKVPSALAFLQGSGLTCDSASALAVTSSSGWVNVQQLPASHYLLTASQKGTKCSSVPSQQAGELLAALRVRDVITKPIFPHYFREFCAVADGSSLG